MVARLVKPSLPVQWPLSQALTGKFRYEVYLILNVA